MAADWAQLDHVTRAECVKWTTNGCYVALTWYILPRTVHFRLVGLGSKLPQPLHPAGRRAYELVRRSRCCWCRKTPNRDQIRPKDRPRMHLARSFLTRSCRHPYCYSILRNLQHIAAERTGDGLHCNDLLYRNCSNYIGVLVTSLKYTIDKHRCWKLASRVVLRTIIGLLTPL